MSPRFPRIIACGAALLLPAVVGPAPPADASWNVGGGTFSGTRTPNAGCFDVSGVVTGLVFNTVITGDVGDINVVGTECGGAVTVAAWGQGPTGSRIDCAKLTGSATTSVATLELVLTGPCLINKFNTGPMDFVATTVLAPTGHFAGVMQVDTDTTRTLIYSPVTIP